MDHLKPGILFIDDDIELLEGYKELFSNDFTVYKTNSPENALNIINNYEIGVVICDYFMPIMSGIEFLTKLLKKEPLIRRILISGQMDVNIAMESIDISKVHKILVKPFIVKEFKEEINTQLKIYKSQMKHDLQLITHKQGARSPFNLFELQTHEVLSVVNTHSRSDKGTEYSEGLSEIINLVLNYSKLFMDLYQKDSVENSISLEYIEQNLDFFDLITNTYDQCYLFAYTLVVRIYLRLLEENISQVRALYNRFTNYIRIHNLSEKIQLKVNVSRLDIIFDGKLNQASTLNEKTTSDIVDELIKLFENNIQENLDLNVEVYDGFVDKTNYFTILILKDKSIVFVKNKLPNIDFEHLCNSIHTFQNLSLDILHKKEMFQTIRFKGGNIQISVIGSFTYVLFSSDETIYSHLKLRKFIVETIDVAKTIPILTIPNKDDIKHVNKLAKELFDM